MLLSLNKVVILISLVFHIQARNTNQAGLNLIKEFEGFRPNFYGDPVGIRTIGYGHACHASDCSKIKAPITKAQGEALLRSDVARFEKCVNDANKVGGRFNDNMFSAVVSFTFNLGCGNIKEIMRDVNSGNFRSAADQIPKYVYAGGKKLPGLVRRRAAERKLFCSSGGC